METIKNQNISWQPPSFPVGATIKNCNISQKLQNTPVGDGTQTFNKCNMFNCNPNGIAEDCLIVQKDLCYWLHPELNLPVEEDECRHVYDQDVVIVDGVVVETIYYRNDI